jgi:hypothetical protein
MLPRSEKSLVLRADFSDDAAWEACCAALRARSGLFRANVHCVNDRQFKDIGVEELVGQASHDGDPTFVFLIDRVTIAVAERPVLVVDLFTEPGRTFRVIPSALGSVENNLSIGNMDFSDFADNVDPDGVFRGDSSW